MMKWNEMIQKEFMFGSVPIKVRVPVDKTLPSNETVMVLLREMFGHPIVEEPSFYVDYTVYKDFMAITMGVHTFDGLTFKKNKNRKYKVAMSLLHMAIDALERLGWIRVAASFDKKVMSYTFILVG